jgi:hypothetical protein
MEHRGRIYEAHQVLSEVGNAESCRELTEYLQQTVDAVEQQLDRIERILSRRRLRCKQIRPKTIPRRVFVGISLSDSECDYGIK